MQKETSGWSEGERGVVQKVLEGSRHPFLTSCATELGWPGTIYKTIAAYMDGMTWTPELGANTVPVLGDRYTKQARVQNATPSPEHPGSAEHACHRCQVPVLLDHCIDLSYARWKNSRLPT